METNELVVQYQAAEKELLTLLEAVEGIEEGNLKAVEETIYRGMFQIGRKVMEGRMKKGKESEPVPTRREGNCGHAQKLVGYRTKKLITLFGEVELKRAYYQCQVEEGQEEEEPKARFDQAAQSKTDAKEREEQPKGKEIARLYIEPDGIMGRMRRESVPMEKYEQERKGDVYREFRVGTVFLAERGNERSELAPDVWIDTPTEGTQQYIARRTALGDFDKLLYTLACQSGLSRAEQVVVIGDGAHWIWDLADEQFPGAVQIVDLYHAQEHVWDVAHAVFGRTTPQGISWAKAACDLLVHGQIEDLVTLIGQLPPLAPPPGQSKSIPEQAMGYFSTNASRMRYPAFRAQGMHVGSGIAEAACKRVVSTRFKQTGMRWTPDGLDAILPLRTAKLNRSFDLFWQTQAQLVA